MHFLQPCIAINYFETISEFQENEFFLEQIGYCYEKSKQFSKGMVYYDKLIQIYPNNSFPWIGKANINIQQENYADALINFKKAYEISPLPSIQSAMAFALELDGKYSEALEIFERRLEKFPDDVSLLTQKANILRKMGQIKPCMEIYDNLLIKKPDHIGVLIGIAKTYERMDRYTSSLEYLDKSLKIEPDNETALKWKVVVLTKMRNFKKASDILNIIKKISGTFQTSDDTPSFNDLKDEIETMVDQKMREKMMQEQSESLSEISIFPKEIYDTDVKMEKLFKSLNGHIWIQDGYLDSKTFEYIRYAMHAESTIKEIRLMFSLSWNTIDKITSLIKKRKKFNTQYKGCNLLVACNKEFGKNYHDRFLFSEDGEWVWPGASTTTQSTRSMISKINEPETEKKDRQEFDRMWNDAIKINDKQKIMNMFKENKDLWNLWKKNHDYSEQEAIESYDDILHGNS